MWHARTYHSREKSYWFFKKAIFLMSSHGIVENVEYLLEQDAASHLRDVVRRQQYSTMLFIIFRQYNCQDGRSPLHESALAGCAAAVEAILKGEEKEEGGREGGGVPDADGRLEK